MRRPAADGNCMGLFDRITAFVDAAGPVGLVVAGMFGMLLILLTATSARMTLLGIYLMRRRLVV